MAYFIIEQTLYGKNRRFAWALGLRMALRHFSATGITDHDDMLPELRAILWAGVQIELKAQASDTGLRTKAKELSNWFYSYSRNSLRSGKFFLISPSQHSTRALLDSIMAKKNNRSPIIHGAQTAIHPENLISFLKTKSAAAGLLTSAENQLIIEIEDDCAELNNGIEEGRFIRLPLFHNQFLMRSSSKFLKNDDGGIWSFWREWYQGFLDGKPIDWELQRRVALIEDAIWEAGPEAVATEIERIRAEFDREKHSIEPRQAEFEPQSVERLFANKEIISRGTTRLTYDISDAIGRFHAETGLNQLPETFQPLKAIPKSLTRISAVLRHDPRTPETEQKLREEVGRLNAKIAQLEKELAKARQSSEPIVAPAYKKQLGTSLGDWKLYAALSAGLWVVSGDNVGIQKRLENILSLRETLFGEDCPSPEPQDFLPDTPVVEI